MKSFLDVLLDLNYLLRLKKYDATPVAFFSSAPKVKTIILYIPGGVKPLGLTLANQKLTSIQPDGFTWKWLPLWLRHKVSIAVVDMPQKYWLGQKMPPTKRAKSKRIKLLTRIINDLREDFPGAKIIGYGHSYGGIEIAELAKKNVLDANIIGSSPWNKSLDVTEEFNKVSIKKLTKKNVKGRTLIVHHKRDMTPKCCYINARRIQSQFDEITVDGGLPHIGLPGLEPGPHFFSGQENEVVRNIFFWIKKRSYSNYIR